MFIVSYSYVRCVENCADRTGVNKPLVVKVRCKVNCKSKLGKIIHSWMLYKKYINGTTIAYPDMASIVLNGKFIFVIENRVF